MTGRLSAHARVAAPLERPGAPAGVLAHHVEVTAQPGDKTAIAFLTAVAEEAAARPFRRGRVVGGCAAAPARRRPSGAPARSARPARHGARCRGMLVASRDALREALAPLPEFAPCRARAVVAFIARIEQLLGRQDAARGLLEQALAAQPDLGSTEATALRLELAAERSSSPTGRACTAMQTRRLGPPGRGPIPR